MLSEETHATLATDRKVAEHEDAAHEKRNWVRLTFDCNNGCVFCLDSQAHDGEMRNREEIKHQILDGRKKGATRLILSGGEPTIHPNYIDFIRLGRLAGYRKIQTVTNGRLFRYRDFLSKCLDAGLSEITFSVHGPNARIHDALVATRGAFDQEMEGLQNALDDGRPVVNIDVVINRGNVRQLPEMLRVFTAMGVKEFDLLQVIPFGRAFIDGRDRLFYDIDAMQPYIREALEFSKRPDLHIWMNRFPPQHLEGFEHLIQDPYKLNDEVRGRKEEYERLLDQGVALDCREPARCRYCYLQRLCDTLDRARNTVAERQFRAVRVDTRWESQQGPVIGGDPASSRKMRLPLLGPRPVPTIDQLVGEADAKTLRVDAPDIVAALREITRFPSVREIVLELERYDDLASQLDAEGNIAGRHLRAARTDSPVVAEQLLAMPYDFEVTVGLTRETAAWLLTLTDVSPRLALYQPTYERLTEAGERDADLREFFARFKHPVPVEGLPACVTGRRPRPQPATLDTTMMLPSGALEIFRYTRRYILDHYRTKSLRCKGCVYNEGCDGLHINHVRAHGYGAMQPVTYDE